MRRAICSRCHRSRAVRNDGTMRGHRCYGGYANRELPITARQRISGLVAAVLGDSVSKDTPEFQKRVDEVAMSFGYDVSEIDEPEIR